MNILIDSFPFDISLTGDYDDNVIFFEQNESTPEQKAAFAKVLSASWTDERRVQASEQLRLARPNMPHATPTLSTQHKENIGKGMKGNSNKTGKRGGNQYTKVYE